MHYPLMPFLHYIIRSKLNNIFHVMEKTKTDLHLETDIWEWFFTTLWSFRWYVATFQQHLHIGWYISQFISEFVFPIRILLLEASCYRRRHWRFLVVKLVVTSKDFWSPSWLDYPLRNQKWSRLRSVYRSQIPYHRNLNINNTMDDTTGTWLLTFLEQLSSHHPLSSRENEL